MLKTATTWSTSSALVLLHHDRSFAYLLLVVCYGLSALTEDMLYVGFLLICFAVSECIIQSWVTEKHYWSSSNVFSMCVIINQQQEEQLQQVGCFTVYWSHLDYLFTADERYQYSYNSRWTKSNTEGMFSAVCFHQMCYIFY